MPAWIGLGSNLDQPLQHLQRALCELAELPQSRLLAHSSIYRSAPLGPPDQPDYLNAVAALQTGLDPDALLTELQRLEQSHGRLRDGLRWGPRSLDLDLLLYDDRISDDPRLTLPHPGLCERAFVLYPLSEIAPQLEVPGHGPLAELLARCPRGSLQRIEP